MWRSLSYIIFSVCIVFGRQPFVSAQTTTDVLPIITSTSTDFIAVTADTPYQTTIAIYGENFDYVFDDEVAITIGPLTATSVAGNSTGVNVTFMIDAAMITEVQADYPIVIFSAGVPVATSEHVITIYNPYQADYQYQQPRYFLATTKHPHQPNKRTIGLNVHWTLGGDTATDTMYQKRLQDSRTVWAREHFSYKLIMGDDAEAWLKRYDQIMLRYKAMNVHVVGMLAYGDATDEFAAPSPTEWKRFVRTVVKRYGVYVDAWELWNEPDSSTYLQPNTWKTYRPLLKTGSAMIREYDPDAIVLNGAIADITNHSFIQQLYKNGRQYFDELNVHVYYCDEYRDAGQQLTRLQDDWEKLKQLVQRYRPKEHIWITELGCSTGLENVDDTLVRRYLKQATTYVLAQDRLRPIFLYTIRDRTFLTPYEAYFGLLQEDFTVKSAWRWYKLLAKH